MAIADRGQRPRKPRGTFRPGRPRDNLRMAISASDDVSCRLSRMLLYQEAKLRLVRRCGLASNRSPCSMHRQSSRQSIGRYKRSRRPTQPTTRGESDCVDDCVRRSGDLWEIAGVLHVAQTHVTAPGNTVHSNHQPSSFKSTSNLLTASWLRICDRYMAR